LTRTPGGIRWHGPTLGEHTDQVLQDWLGMSPDDIEALRANGVV
jgi:crotonobetainyl-CoA:carnitine CoA-transferase CaiB-like acyl-CoA transferase